MLVIFGGLPGVGKSTIASLVAQKSNAVFLRVDIIEQAIQSCDIMSGNIGPAGYVVAFGIAESNLALGHVVIADSVNPLPVTREAWRSVAEESSSLILEVEIICSDAALHQYRVESRVSDIPDLVLPDWEKVLEREYAPWPECDLQIDTALVSAEQAANQIVETIIALRSELE